MTHKEAIKILRKELEALPFIGQTEKWFIKDDYRDALYLAISVLETTEELEKQHKLYMASLPRTEEGAEE